jgi:hypothetical protein
MCKKIIGQMKNAGAFRLIISYIALQTILIR